MAKREKGKSGCAIGGAAGCCRVDSIVSVDARGQMVLPKELRARAGINAGDQLAVVTWENDGGVCCISLIRAEEFGELVKQRLGPMLGPVLAAKTGRKRK